MKTIGIRFKIVVVVVNSYLKRTRFQYAKNDRIVTIDKRWEGRCNDVDMLAFGKTFEKISLRSD